MQLSLTEEQSLIQETARRFSDTELAPIASELESIEKRPLYLEKLKQLADLGFMGLNVDTAYGGTGAGVIAFSLAVTEIARACASTAVSMSVTNLVGEVIQAVGNTEQKQQDFNSL